MIDKPQIITTEPQLLALLHLTIPREQMRSAMGPALSEVMAAVKQQAVGPTGPWFTHHLRMDSATFDFEICVPVSAPFTASGKVEAAERPAMKVACTTYHGPYQGLGAAWSEFNQWIAANGHDPCPDLYECYAVGPETSADPSTWRTEFLRPLK